MKTLNNGKYVYNKPISQLLKSYESIIVQYIEGGHLYWTHPYTLSTTVLNDKQNYVNFNKN